MQGSVPRGELLLVRVFFWFIPLLFSCFSPFNTEPLFNPRKIGQYETETHAIQCEDLQPRSPLF